MITEAEIKSKLRQRLIDFDGNPEPHDLLDIIDDAKEMGMSQAAIARLVPEVNQSINWDLVRAEREQEAEQQRIIAEAAAIREQAIKEAPEYLDTLISYAMADGKVAADELKAIFEKAGQLEQSLPALAAKIKTLLDKSSYRPYPNANLGAHSLYELLMSTDWYELEQYNEITTRIAEQRRAEERPVTLDPPPAYQVPVIHQFIATKRSIKKGEDLKLGWEVSGVDQIQISNLGTTTILFGEQVIRPVVTTRYILTAGSEQRAIDIEVIKPKNRLVKIIIWTVVIIFILRLLASGYTSWNRSYTDTSGDNINASSETPKGLTNSKASSRHRAPVLVDRKKPAPSSESSNNATDSTVPSESLAPVNEMNPPPATDKGIAEETQDNSYDEKNKVIQTISAYFYDFKQHNCEALPQYFQPNIIKFYSRKNISSYEVIKECERYSKQYPIIEYEIDAQSFVVTQRDDQTKDVRFSLNFNVEKVDGTQKHFHLVEYVLLDQAFKIISIDESRQLIEK